MVSIVLAALHMNTLIYQLNTYVPTHTHSHIIEYIQFLTICHIYPRYVCMYYHTQVH